VIARAVVPEGTRERIDAFARQALAGWLPSRNRAKKALKKGLLRLDGQVVETSRFVTEGQELTLHDDESVRPPLLDRDVQVVFEDELLAVVVKPPGLLTNGTRYATLERTLPHNLRPSSARDAMPVPRPVHRLDRSTTGLVVCAKTHGAQVELGRAFQERRVHKRYRAIVAGRLQGTHQVREPVEGRDAHSTLSAVEHTPSLHVGWLTTLDLWPHTGRTHQLRRHCTHLGHPILGDRLYPGDQKILRGAGLFLAAVELHLPHPEGRVLELRIDEPAKHRTFREREARRYLRHHPQGPPEP